jgi:hypothetical protein
LEVLQIASLLKGKILLYLYASGDATLLPKKEIIVLSHSSFDEGAFLGQCVCIGDKCIKGDKFIKGQKFLPLHPINFSQILTAQICIPLHRGCGSGLLAYPW